MLFSPINISGTGSGGSGYYQPFFGNGDGTFSPGTTQVSATQVVGIADFNNDGLLDLFESLYSNGTRVLLQNAIPDTGMPQIDLRTVNSARTGMATITATAERLNSAKSALGAIQSRVQTAHSQLQSTVAEHKSAESRILDVDVATEVANYQRLLIQQQAAAAVLAHANLSPTIALQLLEP